MAADDETINPGKDHMEQHNVPEQADNEATACEAEEKPVREKLRDAAISSQRGSVTPPSSDAEMRQFTPPEDDSPKNQAETTGRLKPARKRSLEDLKETGPGVSNLDAPATPSSGSHARKKSKEQASEGIRAPAERRPEPTVQEEERFEGTSPSTPKSGSDQALENAAMSPRRKRSADDMGSDSGRSWKVAATEEAQKARKSLDEERPNLHPSTLPSTGATAPKLAAKLGGFGNASASSPFASFGAGLSGSKSSVPAPSFGNFAVNGAQTSSTTTTTAPAASSGTNLSFTSAKSPFAAAGTSSKSAFGGGSAFGGASKLSSFASPKGDFSAPPTTAPKLGAFASASGGDFAPAPPRLNAFGSANGGDLSSAKPSRPFGAPVATTEKEKEDDTEDQTSEGEDDADTEAGDEPKQEEDATKFQVLEDVETGEENEETLFSHRAKLYCFENGGWKERGTGTVKLNQQRESDTSEPPSDNDDDLESGSQPNRDADEGSKSDDGASGKAASVQKPRVQARLLMRAMATHRVILNSQIYHEMPIGDPLAIKNPPTGKRMMFLAQDTDGHLQKYLLAIGREDELTKLYQAVRRILMTL